MSFDLIGNGWAVNALRQHLMTGAVRHAYLLTGPQGVGKATLAGELAQALICAADDPSTRPCGQCPNCRRGAARNHPDVHWLESDSGLKIDQIRELQRELALSPFEARCRVAILPDFEGASIEAANALLKTLEEPGPHVVLIITAAMEESVLPTIVSRCEVLALRPLAVAELASALEAGGTDPDDASRLAAQSLGRPGWAMAWLNHPEEREHRASLADDGLRMLELSWADRFEYVQGVNRHKEAADNRRATAEVLEVWLGLWRDVLHGAYGVDRQPCTPLPELEVEKLAARLGPGEAESVLRTIETALQRLGGNANPVLTLETVVLSLPHALLA
jgi:DNA polymerase III subunit delta'